MREIIPQYQPRPVQWEIHDLVDSHRFTVIVAHRRLGKTVCMINHLLRAAVTDTSKEGRYGYIAPYRSQVKDLAWDYLKRFSSVVPDIKINESELSIDYPNGSRIRLYGADNPDAMRGLYFNGVILDEVADMRPNVWGEIIRPALSDRQGWACFIGTAMQQTAEGQGTLFDDVDMSKEQIMQQAFGDLGDDTAVDEKVKSIIEGSRQREGKQNNNPQPLTPEQEEANSKVIDALNEQVLQLQDQVKNSNAILEALKAKGRTVKNMEQKLQRLNKQYDSFANAVRQLFESRKTIDQLKAEGEQIQTQREEDARITNLVTDYGVFATQELQQLQSRLNKLTQDYTTLETTAAILADVADVNQKTLKQRQKQLEQNTITINRLKDRIDTLRNTPSVKRQRDAIHQILHRVTRMAKAKNIIWNKHEDILNYIEGFQNLTQEERFMQRFEREAQQLDPTNFLVMDELLSQEGINMEQAAEMFPDGEGVTEQDVKEVIHKTRFGNMTLEDAKGFRDKIKDLYQQGRREFEAWKQEKFNKSLDMSNKMMKHLEALPKPKPHTPTANDDIRKRFKFGNIGELGVTFWTATQTPGRFLDGLGPDFRELLFDILSYL